MKLAEELAEMSRRLEQAQAHVRRVDKERNAANHKLTEIGRKLGGLKTQLARLAADRAKENGNGSR
jgi:hypothetical protein